ncbi:MAG TPA: hypothetical protein VM680_03395 [Verrucomicrobiae bacterium]|nr:hypothetical protein [Verrucomicrobiae bacterium]
MQAVAGEPLGAAIRQTPIRVLYWYPLTAGTMTTRKTTIKKITKPAAAKTPSAAAQAFVPGQKWQFGVGYAEIVHVGKFLIDYRFHTAPNQKRVPITTDIMTQFEQNLKKNKAKLIS